MAVDPKAQQSINEQNVYIRDTLMSIAAKYSETLKEAVQEAFDDVDATVLQNVGKDLTRSFTKLAKMSDEFANNQYRIKKGVLEQKDVEKQIQSIQEKRAALERKIEHARRLGLEVSEEDHAAALESLKVQEEQLKNDKEFARSISGRIGLQKGLNNLQGKYLSDFKDFFTVAGMMKLLVDATLKADDQTTNLAKNLGISKNQTVQIRENTVAYSRALNDNFVTTDRLIKAQSDLSEQLGIAVVFANEETETFSRLTEIVGLSAQEAGNLAKFSAVSGKEIGKYEGSLLKSAFYAQQTTKTHFSAKQILQDVSKLSAGILAKFQNNPEAIAKAVVQAKALGTTLEQIDKTAESLLNFESSIENELKAELITGRQLNFERARAAALTGDQAELMQEVASQVGTLEDFNNLNVIAQKSLAEAFGMSRDEMADMLIKQEAINKYGDKAAELNAQQLKDFKESGLSLDDYLKKQSEQRSIQDKFNDAVLKLQDILGNLVAGPFGALLDMLSNILNVVGLIGKPFVYFGNVIDAITGKSSSLGNVLKGILATVAAIGLIVNPLATLSALAAGGAFIALGQATGMTKFADGGIVTSEINNATVGEAGPEAIIPLNSPRASGMLGNDLSPLINAITRVENAVAALANKPAPAVALNIDGQKLGEVVGRRPETGTNQYQNTYRLA